MRTLSPNSYSVKKLAASELPDAVRSEAAGKLRTMPDRNDESCYWVGSPRSGHTRVAGLEFRVTAVAEVQPVSVIQANA